MKIPPPPRLAPSLLIQSHPISHQESPPFHKSSKILGFTLISCIYAGWLNLHPFTHAVPLLLTKHPMKENQQLMYVGHIYPV